MAIRRVYLLLVFATLFLLSLSLSHAEEVVEEEEPLISLMEVGAESSISAQADKPLQDVAHLLVEAKKNINRLNASRRPYNVVARHIKVRKTTTLRSKKEGKKAAAKAAKKAEHVNAELIPRLRQPSIHDPKVWGTKYPVDQKRSFVTAEIVGEDGKPYAPRPNGLGEQVRFKSPFAKYIHPSGVTSAADVVNKDPNTKLTALELKSVNSIQLRLKGILDKLGANFVWDHTNVKNRKLISDFEDLKAEARTLMEEYELRTGVKTIAWQLYEPDIHGLYEPNGSVKDIYLAEHPEIASRVLQRGPPRPPPALTRAERRANKKAAAAIVSENTPKEQTVSVAWKKQKDGTVKAKVNLDVVDSKIPTPGALPRSGARTTVLGKKKKNGKRGRDSRAVQIDVVAPAHEKLKRNKKVAAPPRKSDVVVDSAPRINL